MLRRAPGAPPDRTGRRHVILGCAVALSLVLAACGGGGGGGGDGDGEVAGGTTSTEESVSSTEASSGVTGDPATTARKPLRVERPSGTPDGPIFPPGTPAHRLLGEGRCQELLEAIDAEWKVEGRIAVSDKNAFHLYRSAALACLGRWDEAKPEFDKLTAAKPAFKGACGESEECPPCKAAVLRWLTEQMKARARDPGFTPVFVKGTGRSPCPETTTTSSEEGTTSSSRATTTSRRTTTTT